MNRRVRLLARWLPVLLLLTGGCLYPDELRQQTAQLPEHVAMVQSAADQYFQQTKRLPIKESPRGAAASLYEKYVIDFAKLEGYLSQIPPSAFEKGGNFLYVMAVSGKELKVRLFDLRVSDQLRNLQPAVDAYREKRGRLPVAASVGDGWYTIDFQALGTEEVTIPSPYTAGLSLPLVMDRKGKLYVDYRMEIMRRLEKGMRPADEKEDVRQWLVRDSLFVPAYSPPIRLEGGEPVFAPEGG